MNTNSGKPNRNYVIVKFHSHDEALYALCMAKSKFPSKLSISEEMSKIEDNTVYFQYDGIQYPMEVRNFLLECPGAYPLNSGMYS